MFLRECYWTEIMDENEKRFYGFTQNPIKLENEIKNEPGIQNHPRNERNIYVPPTYFSPVDSNAFSYNEPPKCPPRWPPNQATQNLQKHTITQGWVRPEPAKRDLPPTRQNIYPSHVGKRFCPTSPTQNPPPKRTAFSYNEPPKGPPQWSTTIDHHWPAERATQIEPPKRATQNEPFWRAALNGPPIADRPKKEKLTNVNKETFAAFINNHFLRQHVLSINVNALKMRVLAAHPQLTNSYHGYLGWYINENKDVISRSGKKCKLHSVSKNTAYNVSGYAGDTLILSNNFHLYLFLWDLKKKFEIKNFFFQIFF